MLRLLNIDKSIYLVDDEDKSYRYWKRNLRWRKLIPVQNSVNKKSLNGYTRILSNDTVKKNKYPYSQRG